MDYNILIKEYHLHVYNEQKKSMKWIKWIAQDEIRARLS